MSKDAAAKIALMNQPYGQGIASMQRNIDSTETQLIGTIHGKERALEAIFSPENLSKQLDQAGRGYMGKNLQGLKRWAGVGILGETEEKLYEENMRLQLRNLREGPISEERISTGVSPYGMGTFSVSNVRNPNYRAPAADLQVAEVLERNLNKQLEEAHRLRAEIERMRVELVTQGRTPAPSAVQGNRNQQTKKASETLNFINRSN